MNIWDKIEEIIKIGWLVIISIFAPIKVAIIVLTGVFTVNIFVGFKNDKIVHGRDFSLKKMFSGVQLLLLLYVFIFVAHSTISLFDEEVLANEVTKFTTWVMVWFYMVNILSNAKEIFPDSRLILFLYNFMTIQVLDMLFARFGLTNRVKLQSDEEEDQQNI